MLIKVIRLEGPTKKNQLKGANELTSHGIKLTLTMKGDACAQKS